MPNDVDGASARSEREAEIVRRLGTVRGQIARACEQAGRDPQSVTLVAVTKTYPAADVAVLARLGLADIGESKDQEARAKMSELGEAARALRWHFVGQLQTNKARSVVGYAHAVHSVDRPRLVTALADAAGARRETPLEVFVQISLDGDPHRSGVPAEGLADLVDQVVQRPELHLRGVMAVPPIGADADAAFERLRELSLDVGRRHPSADAISAGMSADFEVALRHGATHVRVGTALLGRREQFFS